MKSCLLVALLFSPLALCQEAERPRVFPAGLPQHLQIPVEGFKPKLLAIKTFNRVAVPLTFGSQAPFRRGMVLPLQETVATFGPFLLQRDPVAYIDPSDPNAALKYYSQRPKPALKLPKVFGVQTNIGGGISAQQVRLRIRFTW